jgi:O-antigen/teichoic acid export membrane protein
VKRSDGLAFFLFFALPLLLLWQVTLGGKTLIPADNLFAFPPWSAFASQFNAPLPHNELLSDLLLENYAWKKFIVESLQQGQLPLWNPYLFTGVPFLAAGQHSALYPFSVLFYVFPIEYVYGWFVCIQLGIAGATMYAFTRTLGIGRLGALVAALTYEFSGFFVISLVFPMVISAACWLPLLLLCEEKIIRSLGALRGDRDNGNIIAWIVMGAVGLCVSLLAGHVEIAYYNLLGMAFYGLWRIIQQLPTSKSHLLTPNLQPANDVVTSNFQPPIANLQPPISNLQSLVFSCKVILVLAVTVAFGFALAAVQYVPLYELVSRSFRQGSQPYETIIGYAFPLKQIVTFFIPDFFGNPSHHTYFDLQTWQIVPVTQNALGQPINAIFWGVKNYVEAASYVGSLPLLLALVAIGYWILEVARSRSTHASRVSRFTLLFATLALISLLFIFGAPLYALLFYGLPGFSQLHTPFRWVYPYTLSLAVLAGIGAQQFVDRRFVPRSVAWALIAFGALLLSAFVVVLVAPTSFTAFAERFFRSSNTAQYAYPHAWAFFSYELVNLAKFALFLCGAGIILRIARCPIYLPTNVQSSIFNLQSPIPVWQPLALLLIVVELFTYGYNFNPAADPALLQFAPPAVKFLQEDQSLFRITTLNTAGEKTFNANVGMFYGLQDIRGYDSIIPKQYAAWMNLIEGQGELIYNRIAPFYWHGSLDSALLDLANVKYVLTTQEIPNTAKFTKVYTGEVSIYRNEQALPRAYAVKRASLLQNLHQLKSLEPRTEVLLEAEEDTIPQHSSFTFEIKQMNASHNNPNEVVVHTKVLGNGWLVLSDAYFDGWQAFDKVGDAPEHEIKIYRANGNFRAVQLSEGNHTIRFRYSPLSFRVGAAVSFFAAIVVLLLSGYWAWGKIHRDEVAHTREASRVLKNSALPLATSLLNKALDTVFTLFMLRILGVENAGKLAFATAVIGYCDIFINFGLSTWVTREVSRDRTSANRYLSNTIIVRAGLLVVLAPLLIAYGVWWRSHSIAASDDTLLAIILLALSLVPSSISAALSSIFYAHELMEYPAIVTVVTTLLKVSVGVVVLLAGFGFVGLAGANIFVNLATLSILLTLFVRRFFVPRLVFDATLGRSLLRESYPLMLNDTLSRAFNRIDTLLLQALQGNHPVGFYSTTYKYLEGINLIPSTFTLALFPVLTRYALGAPDALMRAYLKALKYLVILAMPIMVLSFAYADALMWLFGGSAFLPGSAVALRFIIGFLPFSFINNVTHYVLIAVNQQRYLTRTFVVGALFNLVANAIFIPWFSYQASAVITILSEIVLLSAFYLGIRTHVGKVNWLGLLWKPCVAAGVMSVVVGGGSWGLGIGDGGFIGLSLVTYAIALLVLRTLDTDDWELVRLVLPARFKNFLRA